MMGTISTETGMVRIDRDAAEALKRDYGVPGENADGVTASGIALGQLRSIMLPVLERLMTQIQRSIDYYRSKFQTGDPEKIYISGGAALMKNLAPFMSEYLGKETHILNPFQIFDLSEHLKTDKEISRLSPAYAVACGLALGRHKGINLLPAELQEIEKADSLKRIATMGAVASIFLLGILSFNVMSSVSTQEARLRSLTQGSGETVKILNTYKNLDQSKKNISAQIAAFDEELNQLSPKVDISRVLKLLTKVTPDYVTINSMEIRAGGVVAIELKGVVRGSESNLEVLIAQYSVMLEKSGIFSRMQPYETDTESAIQDGLGFTVIADL
jgi:cell division ATPase FtsA